MAASDAPAIQVRDLTRRFGQFVAVDRVTFDVARGEVFGFLGSNGAGKSTTIRMLCGLLRPTSGSALVGGVDVGRDPEAVKRRIGYMSQRFSLYELLTVDQNIRFFGGIYGLDGAALEARRRFVIEMAGLAGRGSTLARDLAGGWRQRLALGCAILHEPAILFLDEPTGGVDPLSRRQFWRLIDSLSQGGVTVLVTTHYLDEAERCHRVALIHAGAAGDDRDDEGGEKGVRGSPDPGSPRPRLGRGHAGPGNPARGREDQPLWHRCPRRAAQRGGHARSDRTPVASRRRPGGRHHRRVSLAGGCLPRRDRSRHRRREQWSERAQRK